MPRPLEIQTCAAWPSEPAAAALVATLSAPPPLPSCRQKVRLLFRQAAEAGLNVARTWAHTAGGCLSASKQHMLHWLDSVPGWHTPRAGAGACRCQLSQHWAPTRGWIVCRLCLLSPRSLSSCLAPCRSGHALVLRAMANSVAASHPLVPPPSCTLPPADSHGEFSLQTGPGEYDEDAFRALDWVVAEAGRAGLRLLLSLADNWSYRELRPRPMLPRPMLPLFLLPSSALAALAPRLSAAPVLWAASRHELSWPAGSLPQLSRAGSNSPCRPLVITGDSNSPYAPTGLDRHVYAVRVCGCVGAGGGVDEYVDWSRSTPPRDPGFPRIAREGDATPEVRMPGPVLVGGKWGAARLPLG